MISFFDTGNRNLPRLELLEKHQLRIFESIVDKILFYWRLEWPRLS